MGQVVSTAAASALERAAGPRSGAGEPAVERPIDPPLETWSGRLARAAFLSALPLVLFGGSVTTLGAGMAVDGWLVAEGHFLLFFPVERWFRDVATFVEHTHRLFGVLTGLFVLAGCAAAWLAPAAVLRTARRGLALGALAAVVAQGTLGGLRVIEADGRLAFVHGALAQAVLAVLAANALVQGRGWRLAAGFRAAARAPGLARGALGLVALVYAQVVLGACYRHALRPEPSALAGPFFLAHALAAAGVAAAVVVFSEGLRRRTRDLAVDARAAARAAAAALRRIPGRLGGLLLAQLALGVLAWLGGRAVGGPAGPVGPLEWSLSVAHVLVGGLLLAQVLVGSLWTRRVFAEAAR